MMKRILEPELMVTDLQCQEYNTVCQRQYANSEFINSYKKYCGLDNGSLIDLGSGPAVHLAVMQKHFPNISITGYENSDKMIEYAKENTTASIMKQDFNKVNTTADCVLCLYTLHHQHDPIKFWNTVSRLSNGYVYIEDFERPNSDKMFDDFDSIDDFKHSLRAAFTLEEIKSQLSECNLNYTAIRKSINADKNLYKIIVYQKM